MFRLFYRRFSEKIFYSTFSTTPEFSLHDVTSSSSNESISSGTEEILDNFTREFRKNRIEINRFQRIFLSMGSSVASLVNPRRHDMISCLGETTGAIALENLLQIMKENPEGQKILQDKPRINTNTIDLIKLRELPENTFGRAYVQFLDKNEVTPDSRMEVKFMDDPDLAYVMTRYRECHDLVHAILGMPTNMLGEVAVKWVEALNTGLPMCYGAAIFGAIRLRTKQRQKYRKIYLPWAIQNGRNVKPLISIYWEKRWEQDIMELRKELNITTLDLKDSI